ARIYGRKAGGGNPALEKGVLIATVAWTLLTSANWVRFDAVPMAAYAVIDSVAAGALLLLVLLEVRARVPSVPKLLYLGHLTLLYGGILVLSHVGLTWPRVGLIGVTGLVHAVEYLAIVSFYVHGKNAAGGFTSGFFRAAAPVWGRTLLFFALAVGVLGV